PPWGREPGARGGGDCPGGGAPGRGGFWRPWGLPPPRWGRTFWLLRTPPPPASARVAETHFGASPPSRGPWRHCRGLRCGHATKSGHDGIGLPCGPVGNETTPAELLRRHANLSRQARVHVLLAACPRTHLHDV